MWTEGLRTAFNFMLKSIRIRRADNNISREQNLAHRAPCALYTTGQLALEYNRSRHASIRCAHDATSYAVLAAGRHR